MLTCDSGCAWGTLCDQNVDAADLATRVGSLSARVCCFQFAEMAKLGVLLACPVAGLEEQASGTSDEGTSMPDPSAGR